MEDQSQKSPPPTSRDTPLATSLPALVDGAALCSLHNGQKTDPFGQEAAPASPSVLRASKKAKKTKGTYGPYGSASSRSVALQGSMESRLLRLFPTDGSTECTLTWKKKDTPSGRLYCQLAPSMRRISATASGLWPTATCSRGDYQKGPGGRKILKLEGAVKASMGLWLTARATNSSEDPKKSALRLADRRDTTATSIDSQVRAEMGCWATPSARDHKDTGDLSNSMTRQDGKSRLDTLPRQAFGVTTTGSSAPMAKRGGSPQLNPAFVCWVMGFPQGWLRSMVSGMQSFPRSRRGSSKRQCKEIDGKPPVPDRHPD